MFQSRKMRTGLGLIAVATASAFVLGACAGGGSGGDAGPQPAAQEGVGPGYLVDY